MECELAFRGKREPASARERWARGADKNKSLAAELESPAGCRQGQFRVRIYSLFPAPRKDGGTSSAPLFYRARRSNILAVIGALLRLSALSLCRWANVEGSWGRSSSLARRRALPVPCCVPGEPTCLVPVPSASRDSETCRSAWPVQRVQQAVLLFSAVGGSCKRRPKATRVSAFSQMQNPAR